MGMTCPGLSKAAEGTEGGRPPEPAMMVMETLLEPAHPQLLGVVLQVPQAHLVGCLHKAVVTL